MQSGGNIVEDRFFPSGHAFYKALIDGKVRIEERISSLVTKESENHIISENKTEDVVKDFFQIANICHSSLCFIKKFPY
jgi:hypothetical protein